MPIGPGVDSEIAIISNNSWEVIHPYLSTNSCRKGMVANPPPIANSPILKK